MNLKLISWNGHNINDGTSYLAFFAGIQPLSFQSGVIDVQRFPRESKSAGVMLSGVTFPITIKILGTLNTNLNQLMSWFDESDQNQYALVVYDQDDSDKPYYVMGRYIGATQTDKMGADTRVLSIYVDDPVWKAVTATTNTISVTASGDHVHITPGGNRFARPKITIKPTGAFAGTSYAYHRHVTITNNTAYKLDDYYFDVTGGGLDTATLVTAGKMQADGDDLRVMVNGKEVPRWLGGMNGASTKVWIQLDLAEKCEFTISENMLATGTDDISVTDTKVNDDMASKLVAKDVILIGTEQILISKYNKYTNSISVLQRGYNSTTAATHTAGDTVKRIEHDIIMQYGNSAASAPDYTDEIDTQREPCFNLSSSTNTSRVFDTYFGYVSGVRPEGWRRSTISSVRKTSKTYTKTQLANSSPRATAMGMAVKVGTKNNKPTAESAALAWTYANPCGIDAVSSTGHTYRNTTSWPAVLASLLSSLDGDDWDTLWTETIPASPSTWTDWTHNATAVDDTHKYIKFQLEGDVAAVSNGVAAMEVLTCTVTLVSASCPTVSLGSETGNYPMSCYIKNYLTGENFKIVTPMLVNSEIVVDTEQRTVTVNGKAARGIMKLSTIRDEWLKMISGSSNQIGFLSTDTGTVTVTIEHRDRMAL